MVIYLIYHTGFPIAVSDVSASGGSSVNSVNAGAAVKKAAQSVETQAQLLTTQLSNKVRGFCIHFFDAFLLCSLLYSYLFVVDILD